MPQCYSRFKHVYEDNSLTALFVAIFKGFRDLNISGKEGLFKELRVNL